MGTKGGFDTFTVLEIADVKTGRKRRRGRPELVRVPVPEGSFFYVLRAPRRTELSTLFRVAARCAPDVLTALPIPAGAGVRPFVPRIFPMHRAAAALCAILPQTCLPPQKLSVGVLDPGGALCGRTDALMPLAADVRIVTDEPQRFDADALLARRQFGASLTTGRDAALLADCDAVICPTPDMAFRHVPVILSCVPADGAFSLLPMLLPERYARLCPQSIPPDLFAAALAEKCGVRVPELLACTGTVFGSACANAAQTADLWGEKIAGRRAQGKQVW